MAKLSDFVSGNQKHEKFTSSGTWTHPNPGEVVHLRYRAAGGGAGGQNDTGTNNPFGGGGGEITEGLIAVSSDVPVSPGAGGAGGAAGSNNTGGIGGDTELNNAPVAMGGGNKSTPLNVLASFEIGGGSYAFDPSNETIYKYGQGSTGGGGGPAGRDGINTQYAFGGVGSGTAGGGGASLGVGGDAGSGSPGATGADSGGGGASDNDGGGGDGGDGIVELFWVE